MAALPEGRPGVDPVAPGIVDLRRVDVDHLNPLLEEETAAWRDELDWDFRPSSELIRRFVHMQALSGFALVTESAAGARLEGYCYYVAEESKGLLGDLFVRRARRTPAELARLERTLLDATLDSLWHTAGMRRVEAQLLMLTSSFSPTGFRSYPRQFLEAPLDPMLKLPSLLSRVSARGLLLTHWTDALHEHTARLIAAAYQGHVDSQINDQYRSVAGARRFLTNIVQFPGCGTFFGPASYAAIDTASKQLRGIALSSLVSQGCGHITQICVAKSEQGTGLGYELARHSLIALRAHGCRSVTLTVTTANETALNLYRRMGFTRLRDFSAYVWDRGD